MKGLVINVLAGVGLFAGSTVGLLAATGRLNHDGTANIPLLNLLFPAPPVDPTAESKASGKGTAANADGTKSGVAPADAAHAPEDQGKQGEPGAKPGEEPMGKVKMGHSVLHPDAPAEVAGEHGGGEKKKEEAAGEKTPKAVEAPAAPAGETQPPHAPAGPEVDFQQLQQHLSNDHSQYTPGAYFHFDGMPAGVTPEKLNEAWNKVQQLTQELEKRSTSLDLRERELQAMEQDTARRQAELGLERTRVETMQHDLEAKIEEFQSQVRLIKVDEQAALKQNAATLASFEPSKAAELIQEQWKTEAGQEEVLKTLAFMDKEAVNTLLSALPNQMTRDLLQKRLRTILEKPRTGNGK